VGGESERGSGTAALQWGCNRAELGTQAGAGSRRRTNKSCRVSRLRVAARLGQQQAAAYPTKALQHVSRGDVATGHHDQQARQVDHEAEKIEEKILQSNRAGGRQGPLKLGASPRDAARPLCCLVQPTLSYLQQHRRCHVFLQRKFIVHGGEGGHGDGACKASQQRGWQ
jgi:hypothetical protein